MDILTVTHVDWEDYVHDMSCANIAVENILNDISEGIFDVRTEYNPESVSSMIIARNALTNSVRAVRIFVGDNTIDALKYLCGMMEEI